MRGLHEDFQASGWVDISRSIAKFNTLLLILTFTKYLKKIFDLLNVLYVATINEIKAIFSPPQGCLKRNEIEHHKVIYFDFLMY